MQQTLTILNQIDVATPCDADWNDMHGDDRVRHCRHCDKSVYNLSILTAEDAVKLIEEREGKLCVRFFRRHDGTVLTADCPVGLRNRIRYARRRLMIWAASLLGFLGFAGCEKPSKQYNSGDLMPPSPPRDRKAIKPKQPDWPVAGLLMRPPPPPKQPTAPLA